VSEILDFSWVYPLHPFALFQTVTRLDHLDEKARYLGHERHHVLELRERDNVFRSITERQVDVEIPWWAFNLFTPRNMITQTQLWDAPSWDGARRYRTRVEVSKVPVSIRGEGRLTPVDITSTHYTIRLEVDSRTPVIGRKIVQVVAGALQRAIDGEHDFRLEWLGRTLTR
jgi:Protein of unknown function (DUF2505)